MKKIIPLIGVLIGVFGMVLMCYILIMYPGISGMYDWVPTEFNILNDALYLMYLGCGIIMGSMVWIRNEE